MLSGERCGSRPLPEVVSISSGTGPCPGIDSLTTSAATRVASAGLLGDRLLALLETVAKAPAEGREWNHSSPVKLWEISSEPRTLPALSYTRLPLAWSGNATWATPVTTSG